MSRARTAFRLLIAVIVLAALSPALYFYGTTWIRGPIEVTVEDVFPIGNKGTPEAKLAYPDGSVHRALNRDQEVLFWKIDSEGIDDELSTASKQNRSVLVWLSGAYMPLFGDRTLFNHMNLVGVDPALPPGALPAATYTTLFIVGFVWLRRRVARLTGRAGKLTGRDEAEDGAASD